MRNKFLNLIKSFLMIIRIFPEYKKPFSVEFHTSIRAEICHDINNVIMKIENNNVKKIHKTKK